MMLLIRDAFVDSIRSHAIASHPEECCGALLGVKNGKGTHVSELLPLGNTVKVNRQRRFLVTPEDYRKAERDASEKGLDIVGFYHSHPDHPARPSSFDLEHAFPGWSYVIISVSKGKSGDLKSWVMKEDRSGFDEEEIAKGEE
jgi:proteasome lid subunit RPN8/RPN11